MKFSSWRFFILIFYLGNWNFFPSLCNCFAPSSLDPRLPRRANCRPPNASTHSKWHTGRDSAQIPALPAWVWPETGRSSSGRHEPYRRWHWTSTGPERALLAAKNKADSRDEPRGLGSDASNFRRIGTVEYSWMSWPGRCPCHQHARQSSCGEIQKNLGLPSRVAWNKTAEQKSRMNWVPKEFDFEVQVFRHALLNVGRI